MADGQPPEFTRDPVVGRTVIYRRAGLKDCAAIIEYAVGDGLNVHLTFFERGKPTYVENVPPARNDRRPKSNTWRWPVGPMDGEAG